MYMKKSKILAIGFLSCLTMGMQAQSWPASSDASKPATRWWWMGSAVNEADLRWNMQQYNKVGLGALEITPIYGVKGNEQNEIDFLSPRWMDMLRVVEEEGKAHGMRVDMNTGTGWPFGGPFVPIEEAAAKLSYTDVKATGAALRKGVNVCLSNDKERTYAQLSRVMAYVRNETTGKVDQVIDLTTFTTSDGQVTWKKAAKKQSYQLIAVYCSRTLQKVKRAAPGGHGYVIDHFDKKAVAHYLNHFTQAFKSTKTPYPSVFFNDSYEVFGANWTPMLFEEFEKRRGYKLENHLLELLGLQEDGNQVLSDYRETLGEMLLENFTIQWTEWAHQHGVNTRNQAHGSPADVMDVFSVVDIPETEGFNTTDFGIRGLRTDRGFTRKSANAPWMLKMASSAAHVGGKPLTSCESFTWQTEHFRTSLSQIKPEVDYLFTSGVNHVFFHGTAYSPRDVAWPGWKFYASMDMSPTNSIWRDAPFLMKYIERCQSYLQSGVPTNDLLVLMPIREMWHKRIGTGAESLLMQFDFNSIRKNFPEFVDEMQRIEHTGLDYDYISEKNILGLSYVDGKLQTAVGTRYAALVIPGKGILSDAAKAHLEKLRQQGAPIVYGIDGERIQQVAKAEPMCKDEGLRMIRRKNQDGYFYFIANLSPRDIDKDVKLAVDAKDARWFDPMDGKIYKADLSDDGVKVRLKSGESMILQTYQTVLPTKADDQKLMAVGNIVKPLDGKWLLSFKECVPMVDKTFALDTLQTWETLVDDSVKVTMGTGVYTTTVTMTAKEAKEHWMIYLGDVRESARVYVNDHFVGCAWAAPFELKCGNFFQKGRNTIRIEVTNLPANRIAEIDRKGIPWRNFKEINFVNINYKKTSFANWKPVKSGLNSPVYLRSLQ